VRQLARAQHSSATNASCPWALFVFFLFESCMMRCFTIIENEGKTRSKAADSAKGFSVCRTEVISFSCRRDVSVIWPLKKRELREKLTSFVEIKRNVYQVIKICGDLLLK
jgi:hypothetical protein